MGSVYNWNKEHHYMDSEHDLIWDAMIDWCYMVNDMEALHQIILDEEGFIR